MSSVDELHQKWGDAMKYIKEELTKDTFVSLEGMKLFPYHIVALFDIPDCIHVSLVNMAGSELESQKYIACLGSQVHSCMNICDMIEYF